MTPVVGGSRFSTASTRSARSAARFSPHSSCWRSSAIGDRLAIEANLLRSLGATGFNGYVISWAIVTFVVVFPAAFIAGIQFPLLISLLGRGSDDIGRHVGMAYAWNTAGAIAGSLAGGF